jgi:integrase
MRKAGDNPYLPWNKEELKALVNAPLLRETAAKDRVTPAKHTLDHALMWAPLIALFGGLRSEEICQLKPSDVRRESGVWFFNVSEEDGGSVKTRAGTRKVPVHSALIRMGFLQYAAHVAKHPSGRLFPGLRPYGRDKKLNGYITRRMGAYFEAIGVSRPMVTFHSFRKNVVGALERERVHQSEIARLVGHEPGFTVKTYNPIGLGLRELRAIVEKIKYPGLKLSHLAWPSNGVRARG